MAQSTASGTVLEGVRQKVFLDRYSLKDRDGQPLERYPEEMWRRVARGIAAVEATEEKRRYWEEKFYWAMTDFKFVPGGRILAGAGTGHKVTFYNCYVIPSPEDSRSGILDNLKIMTEIMARGGGVGVNLSTLRPRGSYIRTVNGTASGPCSWAELYSVATGDVIQQGGSRRGALMLMLDDTHPDVEEFITVKQDRRRINHANLSVCISDAFMEAVKNDEPWDLVWDGKVRKTVRARDLWDLICRAAWDSAEPGVVFMDRVNKLSNTWYYENIRCVNPCGEQPLPPWGVCNLGAINLAAFVKDGQMDWALLEEHVRIAMRFLDNVVDANEYFFEENRVAQLNTRRTGLGTMGLADALIKMQVRYGSEESLAIIEEIYRRIRDAAYDASCDLAAEKGPFPMFDREKYLQGAFIRRLPERLRQKIATSGIRNAVLLTQAPTGTTSLLAGVSSGIEPVFDFVMLRRDRLGEHLIYHPLYDAWRQEMRRQGKDPDQVPRPPWFVSANELTPEEHVRVQAVIQKYTDASISKTVNAPNSHTVEDVKKLYTLAYELGCKGITYYRDGCREAVLEHVGGRNGQTESKKTYALPPAQEITPTVKPRPTVVHGYTRQIIAPEGKVNITLNSDENGLLEVFINVGKAGSDIAALAEALGRLISLCLRLPSPMSPADRVREIADQLRGIGGSRAVGFGPDQVRSLPDAIAKALAMHLGEYPDSGNGHRQLPLPLAQPTGNLCPRCGCNTLVNEEGCRKCHACGHSEC